MEKKNTILLTVIAVATLLVAVVGATFAYFTATSGTDGDGASTGEVKTATVASVKLTTAEVGKTTNTVYPGTMNYAAMSVAASKEGTDSANYTLTYTVNGTVTLGAEFTEGDVYYTVYRTTSQVATPVACSPVSTKADPAGTQYSQSCNTTALTSASAEEVQAKTAVEGTSASISIENQSLTTESGKTYYYYLVVEYENTGTTQNLDQNKSITAELTDVSITDTAQAGA